MRILSVENDAVFAGIVVTEFLAGHDVEVVPCVELALHRARQERFDVVLVDYDLDDGKGTLVVEGLVANGYDGRVVAVSSHDRGNQALVAAGAHDVCPKMRFAEIDRHL